MDSEVAVELLKEIVEDGCQVDDPDEGAFCFFCEGDFHVSLGTGSYYDHHPKCLFVRAQKLVEGNAQDTASLSRH